MSNRKRTIGAGCSSGCLGSALGIMGAMALSVVLARQEIRHTFKAATYQEAVSKCQFEALSMCGDIIMQPHIKYFIYSVPVGALAGLATGGFLGVVRLHKHGA
jgi:hypothetical protein